MYRIQKLAGCALFAVALAACSPSIHSNGHRISFDATGMVVHARGHADAHVTPNGDLSIDGKAIAVTAPQRAQLQQYYTQARGTLDSGEEIGKQGVSMAKHGIDTAIDSIFHDGKSSAEAKLDAQSEQIEAAADKLCGDLQTLNTTQQAIAASIPAFAPYAAGSPLQCHIVRTTTVSADGQRTTTTTRMVMGDDSAATSAAPSPSSSQSHAPDASK